MDKPGYWLRVVKDDHRRPRGPVLVQEYPVAQVEDDHLQAGLSVWREMAPTNVLIRAEHDVSDLLNDLRFNRSQATVILVGNGDPLEWRMIYHGNGFIETRRGERLTRVGHSPFVPLIRASAATYAECIRDRQPKIHRISGYLETRSVVYDRLLFPSSAESSGPIDMLITLSSYILHY